MSARKSRHLLMQAIIRSSPLYGTEPQLSHVEAELAELGRCARLQPVNRQRLLQVLHASRAIDTCLSTILRANGITPSHGIGGKLRQLKTLPPTTRGYLNHAAAIAFDTAIAYKRNRYAHAAGTFPTSTQEVDTFVSEIHACLTMIA